MGFGGGDDPSNTQYATQFSREAPEIEAAKLGLMGTARDLTRFGTNPWELINKDAEEFRELINGVRAEKEKLFSPKILE